MKPKIKRAQDGDLAAATFLADRHPRLKDYRRKTHEQIESDYRLRQEVGIGFVIASDEELNKRTTEALRRYKLAAQQRIARRGCAITHSRGKWHPAEHLIYLDEKLRDIAAGRIKRLMVFMPPRHGKSELISKYFPAWYLGTFPNNHVISSLIRGRLCRIVGPQGPRSSRRAWRRFWR